MPGIYVRTLNQFDWLNQEKESLLTIPGSYWLCHKKNIYKFIFKYHRSVKNTMQFSYGRELLKIVRRIIKCHPSQGQQFGTPHLLVTYNCTSWTRQDKMFAILKFQQRTNAATFSHAFVLTIRIYPSSEHSLFNLKYPIVKEADAGTTFKDLNVSLDTKEKVTETMIYTDKESPKKTTIYQNKEDQISKYSAIEDTFNKTLETNVSNFQDNILKNSENFDDSLNATIKSATTTAEMHFINTEFQGNINENKSTNCNIQKCERKIDQHLIDIRKQSSRTTKKMDKIPIEKIDGKNEETKSIVLQEPNQEIQNIRKYKIFSSLKSEMIKDDVDKWTLSNGFGFYENSMEKNTCSLNNKNILDDDGKMISETIANPDNVPDQYFIEKELQYKKRLNSSFSAINQPMQRDFQTINNINEHSILEVTKKNNNESIHTKHCNEITDLNSQKDYRQHTAISINTNDNLSIHNTYNKSYKIRKQKNRESEKKTIPDDKVLRSSNITDLVMEGLMFTIRQDQDSVAVIEQRTKLEMDEVLENSEKVETKAGEKCLLNSSLLRLENLVTMIDSPREHKDQQHKTICHTISNNTCLSPFNISSSSPVYNLDVNSIDDKMGKLNIPASYDKHNVIDYLNPCESQWQRKCMFSSIKNSNGYSGRGMITERSEQLMEHQDDNENNREDRNNIKTEKEQKKDLIPQVFQSILFSSEKKNAELQNEDLLTDNTDIEETSKHEMSTKKFYNSPSSCSLLNPRKENFTKKENSIISKESDLTKLPRQEANGPRIVSDKAITIEQMPLALQKVIQHTCKTRKLSSTSNNEMLQHEQKTQDTKLIENATSETAISFIDNNINSNIKNNSSVEFKVDPEESYKNESCVTVNKDTLEINEDICMKNTKEKNNESDYTSQKNLSSKNSLPRKLQDITEDFYYDLLHARNKDNAIRQRCLRQRQRSLNNSDNIKNAKVRIEMLKFIQDITEGARVVVKRLDIDK